MFKPLPTYPTLPVPELNILYKLEQLKSHRHTQDYWLFEFVIWNGF